MAAKGPDQARANNSKPKATKIKVKQDMIDSIKGQGMTRALKRAAEIKASGTKGEAEFLEGVRRMYGDRRLAEATAAVKSNTSAKSKNQTPPKTAAYAAGKVGQTNKASDYKKAPSKGMSTKDKALAAAGVLGAGATLALTRGRGTAAAAKMAPGLAKLLRGKPMPTSGLVIPKIKNAASAAKQSATSTAGRVAAKAGKPVSQTQYDAMIEAAKAKGMTAAKAAAAKSAKAAPKVTPKKAAATAGVGVGGSKAGKKK